MLKRGVNVLLVLVLLTSLLTGCTAKREDGKVFTAYIAMSGMELAQNNRIMTRIEQEIGARAEVGWLTGQSASERIQKMIANGKYPDFIDGSDATDQLLEAGALIPLDEYLPDYPNLQNYLTDKQWNSLRQEDGHIYYIPQFDVIQGEDMSVHQEDEAFWIQKRVLKWAGYPTIRTLDEYFDLINAYVKENPVDEEGDKNIGFEILCDDWKYFCLENVPQFLAGYPNDGCAIVDPETLTAHIYDDIPEAKQYYQKLCQEYNKGMIDPETFTLSYAEYIEKLANGNVIGMVDQYWNFQAADNLLYNQGKVDRSYVPLGIVANESITDAYRAAPSLNIGSGLGITVDCKDVEGALQFLNDLLDPEIMVLRYWGEEGIDYEVDEDGLFYRTSKQRLQAGDVAYYKENFCNYGFFPHYEGMLLDGINAVEPWQQPKKYYSTLGAEDREVLDAYGYEKWTDFLTPMKENPDWFPLYSETNQWTSDTVYREILDQMNEIKHLWLPKVIMSSEADFEATWQTYQDIYKSNVEVDVYESKLTCEVRQRVKDAQEK